MNQYVYNKKIGAHVERYYTETRLDAEYVLSDLLHYSGEYGFVTVADYYEALEIPTEFTHNAYGWTHQQMLNVRVLTENGVYYLGLPDPMPVPTKENEYDDYKKTIVITDEASLKEAIELVIDVLLDMYGRVVHVGSELVAANGEYRAILRYYNSSGSFHVFLVTKDVITWDGNMLKIKSKHDDVDYFKIRKEEK